MRWSRKFIPLTILSIGLLLGHGAWAQSTTFTLDTLVNFAGANGAVPVSNLIQASDGNFYGTTLQGGANGAGTVFQVTPAGALTTIHSFSGTDGRYPYGSLVEGGDGCLYGTTTEGGALEQGSIFRITPDGTLTTLHSFSGADGNMPYSNLIQATDGNFYGTTAGGGPNDTGYGSVFRMTPAGIATTLYSFAGNSDGEFPFNNLLQASNGKLYGVTSLGGSSSGSVLFQSSLEGLFYGIPFTGDASTFYPSYTALDESSSQNLNGTITTGGATGHGEVFRIGGSGEIVDAYDFSSGGDGGIPFAGLFLATDGNQYGTTAGYFNDGGVFSLSPAGALQTLATFSASTGQLPASSLIQGADGNFYGNTSAGGSAGDGTLFRLVASDPLLAPVQLSLSAPSVAAGSSVRLSWQVANAYSDTLQQCYAFVSGNAAGAGNWTGLQHGELSGEYYSGSATIVPTEPGEYSYALTCGGVESGIAKLVVSGTARAVTETALSVTPSAITQGQNATLVAKLSFTMNDKQDVPSGSVTFRNGAETIGQVALSSSGTAGMTANTSGILAGQYLLTASYSGDANYAPSNSASSLVALLAGTGITLSATPASIVSGATATLLATVAQKAGSQTPTGVVTFLYGSRALGQSNLLNGQTTWVQSTQGLGPGSYTVHAVYAGDAGDAPSTSTSIAVTITP